MTKRELTVSSPMQKFLQAYDEWVENSTLLDTELFEAMVMARQELEQEQEQLGAGDVEEIEVLYDPSVEGVRIIFSNNGFARTLNFDGAVMLFQSGLHLCAQVQPDRTTEAAAAFLRDVGASKREH